MTPPVIFLGPSLPRAEAERIVRGDYRPPVKRDDLEQLAPGTVVAIIDGVFDQTLSVSPAEIGNAIRAGITVLGSSSMGALRAAEVPGMEGVGRIAARYRDGVIVDDDEVALVFDPETLRTLSEPLVNIRYAVERLVYPGSLDPAVAARILRAAKHLPYPERSYRRIFQRAGLAHHPDAAQLMHMLRTYDLKREDAVALLERLRDIAARPAAGRRGARRVSYGPAFRDAHSAVTGRAALPADAPVLLWEYGDPVPFRDLVDFLKITGAFPR